MADDFQVGSTGNWWDSSRNPSSSVPGEPLPWTSSSQPAADSTAAHNNNSDFQIMGLGRLNSHQTHDWINHHPNLLIRDGEKTESSNFRSMIQERLYSEHTTGNVFKQSNRGFSLDNQSEFSSSGTEPSQSTYNSDPMIGYGSPSAILLQGLLATDQDNRPMNNNYAFPTNYDTMNTSSSTPWNKFPNQYINSPSTHDQSQPFWNSPGQVTNDPVRPGFFQSNIPPPFTPPITFEEKPEINNNTLEGPGLGSKKNNNNMNTIDQTSNKRARSETTASPLPAFKVRKEKMGDRITALQQLVSPFGKTDTASVLSEAITYIKFLHEQVGVLSSPYMKNGPGSNNNSMQQQQPMKSKEVAMDGGGGLGKQDLRSRGLCLVPVSSTFPVTHEPTVDYWNPTFGGTFR